MYLVEDTYRCVMNCFVTHVCSVLKFVKHIRVCIKVLEATVMVFTYSDGIWGGNLGLMNNLLLQLDQWGGNLGIM